MVEEQVKKTGELIGGVQNTAADAAKSGMSKGERHHPGQSRRSLMWWIR